MANLTDVLNGEDKPTIQAIVKETIYIEASKTVTVGSGGDYTTINAALEVLSKQAPMYKQDGITNFITYDGENYLIYGISVNNYHNELSTVFKPSIRQLIKCKKSMNFFSEKFEVEFEEYIKN